ncbi:MAG: hypothetical protein IKZ56_06415 [Bacteroidales bacterium]|nr:hypothetical protein [Bacteroidales bacterium]
MKKALLLIAMMLCCVMTMFAQNDKISYQAVVRDTENKLVPNKSVEVTVHIYNGNATTAAYTETKTVTTNLNGLISLQIGPDGTNADWNSIQWSNARIETTVKLDGTELGTLEMPLTAVPYAMNAKYVDNIDPMAITSQLHDTANNVRNEMSDAVNSLGTDISNLSSSVDTAKANIRGEIGNAVSSVGARIDSLAFSNDTAQTNIRGEIGNAVSSVGVRIDSLAFSNDTAQTNIRGEIGNAVSSVGVRIDSLAFSNDTAQTNIRGEIATLSNEVETNYATKTELSDLSQQLTNTLNALTARIDSVINVMNNLPTRMVEERDTVQTAGQTNFTLSREARTDCVVRLYINGVMVGGNYNGVVTLATSNSQTTVTYVPAQNKGYALKANDKVTIVYWY